ncbi:MAG: thioredoxin domain-containing protein [Chloroflexi bacterium]|nr:thioredoxin domain-containing protein [Chloroflexota bacterium]
MSHFHFSPRPNRASEINWHDWNSQTFAEAKQNDKPILLGISAVWCHWCHVMDETSYSDGEVIRLINERFVPIRVDNDQRPDVNRRYNLGGWPTTAFLTPEGELLTGGTYIPPSQMRAYLAQVSDAYKHNKLDILAKIGEMNVKREQALGARSSRGALSQTIVDTVARDVLDQFDAVHGGFGTEPKFPHTDAIELALERYHATRDERLLPVVTVTLTHMASGGTYDQEAGGFFRYSTTRDWSVPHFEKMLEDNAKLFAVLAHAHQVAPREIFVKTMNSMTAYLNATLSDQTRGGFYGSQDADEAYYALPLAERAKLVAPYVDRNFYTDWNALMVNGYLEASHALGDESLIAFALKTLDRIWNAMFRADVGLLHYATPDGAPQLANQLADLAHTTRAYLDAYQFTGDVAHLTRAQSLADLALAQLLDASAFISEPRAHETLGLLRVPDHPLAENAAMADALTRLHRFTGEERYRDAAEKSLAYFAGEYSKYGFMAAEYARAVSHLLTEPITVHIVGDVNDAHTRALHRAALDEYAPAKIVQVLDPARDVARIAQLGYPANVTPRAYVCVGQKCLAPASEASGVLEGMRQILQ